MHPESTFKVHQTVDKLVGTRVIKNEYYSVEFLYFQKQQRHYAIKRRCCALFTKTSLNVPPYADRLVFAKSALIFRSLPSVQTFVYTL